MRFTKRQIEVLLITIATLRDANELDLAVNGQLDDVYLFEWLLKQNRRNFGTLTESYKLIIRNLIDNSREHCSTQLFNNMAINAMKAGCGSII